MIPTTTVIRIGMALIALCVCAGVATAVPPLPTEYHGAVTIDGSPAPANTVIRAVIDGEVRGELAVSSAGMYGGTGTFDSRLVISGNESDVGKTVAFTINGVPANQTMTFTGGEAAGLDLSAVGAVRGVPGGIGSPQDLDASGKYSDVNGNGRTDFADVVLYFDQMTWIAANEPVSAFDYNGNGRIDFADVVWLFNHL